MTTSFDQDGQVRAALKRTFRDHGRAGLDQVDLIALAAPGDSLDERLVRAAAECGVAGMLDARIAAGFEVDAAIRAVVLHMSGRTGLDLIGCDWIVYEYALAIGLVSEYPTVSGDIPTPAAEVDDVRADTSSGHASRVVVRDIDDFSESADESPPAEPGTIPEQPSYEVRIQDRPVPPGSPGGPVAQPIGVDQTGTGVPVVTASPEYPPAPLYPPMHGYPEPRPMSPGSYPPGATEEGNSQAPATGYPASPSGGYPAPPSGGGYPGGAATGGYTGPPMPPPGGYDGVRPAGGAPGGRGSNGAPSHAQEVVEREMRRGVLAVNAKDRMRQGRKERVEVGIARTDESAAEMVASLTAAPRLSAEVNTADYMQLQLVGDGFAITALSPPQQLVIPTARWDFDVVPLSSGSQSLSVIGTCWFTVDGQERAMAVPAFVRMVQVEVDNAYRVKRALAGNWQWIIGTILGLGGSIAAWIALFG